MRRPKTSMKKGKEYNSNDQRFIIMNKTSVDYKLDQVNRQ